MNPTSSELQLRDIHLPPDIGAWPPAFGWWILLLLLVVLLLAFVKFRKTKQPLSARSVCQPALSELTRIEREFADEPDQLIKAVSVLLRRSAISLHGRHRISGLTGSDWLSFLDQQSDEQIGEPLFDAPLRRMLTELPYREQGATEVEAETGTKQLVTAVRQWLESQQNREMGHV